MLLLSAKISCAYTQLPYSSVRASFSRIPPPLVHEDENLLRAQREATLRSLAHQLDLRLRKVRMDLLLVRVVPVQQHLTGISTL